MNKLLVLQFHLLISALFLIIILSACNNNREEKKEEVPEIIESTDEIPLILEYDLEKIIDRGELTAAKIIDVAYDPVFKRAKKYKAIPLKSYLKKIIESENLDTAQTEIIFLCKDGYNPSMSLAKVLNNESYLAIKDVEAPEGKNWMDTLQGKWTPFYLIWTNHSKNTKGFTWPYGLKFLKFKPSKEAYKAAYPEGNVNMVAGFELYKSRCMKCHSINKVGGVMGPEFNIPKNITEYWKKEDIIAFVKNPYAYRYNSKMPPVAGIKDTELEQIYAYLEYMKGQKIEVE